MSRYSLLLKKQFFDSHPLSLKSERSKNIIGYVLAALLVACIIAVFAIIFATFTKTYSQIKINRVPDVSARQFEIMSIAYFILIIVFIVTGTNSLCYTLFENSDINILISMPFSAFEIFAAKLTWVYVRQTIASLIAVLTVNLTFFITENLISAYNVLMSFFVAFILPIFPLSVASIIALPYYYLKRIITSHYLLNFAVMTALLAAFCILYAKLFGAAEQLLGTDKISTLFNEHNMGAIARLTENAYPANLIAGLMLGRDIGKNIGILIGILVGALAIGLPIIHAIFIRVTQTGFAAHVPHVKQNTLIFFKRNKILSLINKEFITVLRTPGYSYMYFATAIIMPVMAYYSAKFGSEFLSGLLGNIRFDFEICTFIVLLYATLTNTFCSTNISRDGYMSMMQKTLPYSPAQILGAKMIFSGIVSEASILAACIILVATKIENPADGVVTFISASMLAVAQIAFATRLDLNHPHFSRTDDGEIKESNSNVSVIILTGIIVCFAIGVLLLFNTVSGLITGVPTATDKGISYVYALVIPLLLLAASAAYFFINLNKVYQNLDVEN